MTHLLSTEQALLLRTRAQGLYLRDPAAGVAQIVRACGGVQAQDAPAAALSVGVRGAGLTAADVERARVAERSVIRTWAMRGTLHLIATEDAGWLLPLLGPGFIRADAARRAQLGLDEATCARAIRLLCDALAGQGPRTQAEIIAHLGAHGIPLTGQAAPHLLARTALEGWICRGPERGGKPTYVLLADWVRLEPPLEREAALTALARRYLAAFGPAAPEDLAAWSGLPMSDVRRGWQAIADQFIKVELAGRPAWLLSARAAWLDAPAPAAPVVRLLPAFDTYVLGYRHRDLFLAPQYSRRINAGGGMIRPMLLVDGRIAGTWRSARRSGRLDIQVEPFAALAPTGEEGLECAARDVGRFLETEVMLKGVPLR